MFLAPDFDSKSSKTIYLQGHQQEKGIEINDSGSVGFAVADD
jgi:hypothetical protein